MSYCEQGLGKYYIVMYCIALICVVFTVLYCTVLYCKKNKFCTVSRRIVL